MKRSTWTGIALLLLQLILIETANAQLLSPPTGGNKKASVSEEIGITDVTINYSRPHVKHREGHIWGEVIQTGYVDMGVGTSKASPWRAGANENTTIEFSTDIKIEGQPLPAGRYGLFIAYDPNESTLIFSKNSTSWGAFYYNPAEDALRVKVKPITVDKSVEWLKYEFTDQTSSSAVVQLQWEKQVFPFKVEVDLINTQLESFRKELRGIKGFGVWENWDQAASFCADNKVNLEEALLWANNATDASNGGSQIFEAWNTKAAILDDLGRSTEAAEIRKKALPYADMFELYGYARTLAGDKKIKEALDIFKMDYDKHPDIFLTNTGMARGYMAAGDNKKALEYALKAQKQAQGKINMDVINKIIKDLQSAKM